VTNRISLYVAADSTLQNVKNLAKREQIASRNVQSNWTRTEVQAAWRNILTYLAGLKEIPPNGLVLFASSEGVEAIEPPTRNMSNQYKCGTDFYREPLDALRDLAQGEKYGLILIDNNEAAIAWWRGEVFVSLWHEFSGVMGKHRMGGQSQARFQRGHREQVKQWQRKVAGVANELLFQSMGITKALVAGPGFCKRELVEDRYLDYRLHVMGIVDAEYCEDVAGPREALARWKLANEGLGAVALRSSVRP